MKTAVERKGNEWNVSVSSKESNGNGTSFPSGELELRFLRLPPSSRMTKALLLLFPITVVCNDSESEMSIFMLLLKLRARCKRLFLAAPFSALALSSFGGDSHKL